MKFLKALFFTLCICTLSYQQGHSLPTPFVPPALPTNHLEHYPASALAYNATCPFIAASTPSDAHVVCPTIHDAAPWQLSSSPAITVSLGLWTCPNQEYLEALWTEMSENSNPTTFIKVLAQQFKCLDEACAKESCRSPWSNLFAKCLPWNWSASKTSIQFPTDLQALLNKAQKEKLSIHIATQQGSLEIVAPTQSAIIHALALFLEEIQTNAQASTQLTLPSLPVRFSIILPTAQDFSSASTQTETYLEAFCHHDKACAATCESTLPQKKRSDCQIERALKPYFEGIAIDKQMTRAQQRHVSNAIKTMLQRERQHINDFALYHAYSNTAAVMFDTFTELARQLNMIPTKAQALIFRFLSQAFIASSTAEQFLQNIYAQETFTTFSGDHTSELSSRLISANTTPFSFSSDASECSLNYWLESTSGSVKISYETVIPKIQQVLRQLKLDRTAIQQAITDIIAAHKKFMATAGGWMAQIFIKQADAHHAYPSLALGYPLTESPFDSQETLCLAPSLTTALTAYRTQQGHPFYKLDQSMQIRYIAASFNPTTVYTYSDNPINEANVSAYHQALTASIKKLLAKSTAGITLLTEQLRHSTDHCIPAAEKIHEIEASSTAGKDALSLAIATVEEGCTVDVPMMLTMAAETATEYPVESAQLLIALGENGHTVYDTILTRAQIGVKLSKKEQRVAAYQLINFLIKKEQALAVIDKLVYNTLKETPTTEDKLALLYHVALLIDHGRTPTNAPAIAHTCVTSHETKLQVAGYSLYVSLVKKGQAITEAIAAAQQGTHDATIDIQEQLKQQFENEVETTEAAYNLFKVLVDHGQGFAQAYATAKATATMDYFITSSRLQEHLINAVQEGRLEATSVQDIMESLKNLTSVQSFYVESALIILKKLTILNYQIPLETVNQTLLLMRYRNPFIITAVVDFIHAYLMHGHGFVDVFAFIQATENGLTQLAQPKENIQPTIGNHQLRDAARHCLTHLVHSNQHLDIVKREIKAGLKNSVTRAAAQEVTTLMAEV